MDSAAAALVMDNGIARTFYICNAGILAGAHGQPFLPLILNCDG